MADETGIEWADSTFNPWMGCTRVSPACDDCYAARSTPARSLGVAWGSGEPRRRTSDANWKLPLAWNSKPFYACRGCAWRGDRPVGDEDFEDFPPVCPACASSVDTTRRRVFCASLADVFDNEVDPAWRADLFALISKTPNLDWMLLTKRIGNANQMMREANGFIEPSPGCYTPRPNVWLGATVVNQAEADRDIPKLLAAPARVRFLSIEPMLGPLDVRFGFSDAGVIRCPRCMFGTNILNHGPCPNDGETLRTDPGIDWVIVGGESGPKARPMHPDWVRSLRDQCETACVPFLFKQWGEWCPRGPESFGYPSVDGVPRLRLTDAGQNGQNLASRGGNDVWMNRAGKKAAGRHLEGVTHDGFPTGQGA